MARRNNGLATASFICSLVGFVPFLFGIPCALGIIFGFVALGQIKRSGGMQEGRGLAIAGIIIGFTLVAIFLIAVIGFVVAHNNFCANNPTASGCNGN